MTERKKLVLIGRPETGKTSIRKVIFEGVEPQKILDTPLKATRGLSTSQYEWLDLDCAVFDTAGQNYQKIFTNETFQMKVFAGSSIIIYLFDCLTWNNPKEKGIILKDIKKIQEIIREHSYEAEVILFLHKIDLLLPENKETFTEEVNSFIVKKYGIPVYFTSLVPKYIYSLYSAFHEILSHYSEKRALIKEKLDEHIQDLSKTMFFVTNDNNSIVAQSMTEDFDVTYINHAHHLIAELNQTLETMKQHDKVNHLILQTIDELNIIMNFLNLMNYNLKNLICISETLTSNKLIWKAGELLRDLIKIIRAPKS